MTQEDKKLLLKDLSSRLPYTTVFIKPIDCNKTVLIGIKNGGLLLFDNIHNEEYYKLWDIEYCKPYLRSMSSMTEEEFAKLKEYSGLIYDQLDLTSFQNGTYKCLDFYLSEVPSYVVILVFDWLNAHHFDYRGLIEKGLALEAPEGMYN